MPLSPKRRKLHVWRDQLGLTKVEMLEIARYLLRRDITSSTDLTDEQVDRMLDALEGAHLVIEQYAQRPPDR